MAAIALTADSPKAMRRILIFATIAAAAAYFAARWALREKQTAQDEAAGANWENEGGAAATATSD